MVLPIAVYGTELFAWSDRDLKEIRAEQIRAWRLLLRVGGRSPLVCLSAPLGIHCCTIEFRVREVAHFLRLLNAQLGHGIMLRLLC